MEFCEIRDKECSGLCDDTGYCPYWLETKYELQERLGDEDDLRCIFDT